MQRRERAFRNMPSVYATAWIPPVVRGFMLGISVGLLPTRCLASKERPGGFLCQQQIKDPTSPSMMPGVARAAQAWWLPAPRRLPGIDQFGQVVIHVDCHQRTLPFRMEFAGLATFHDLAMLIAE